MYFDFEQLLPLQKVGPQLLIPLQLIVQSLDLDCQIVYHTSVVIGATAVSNGSSHWRHPSRVCVELVGIVHVFIRRIDLFLGERWFNYEELC
jgi:hypothetical protein